ncbi:PREDICTED: E3 ubiquitin-protein ligase ZNRF3-like, partial [Priapulus caudatus]|uniref:RING-type E3 ubiquitin transferase n=1 Tax=Priapulus caudatus TaxID=37621 RepID=A0ABM1F3F0_PRICU
AEKAIQRGAVAVVFDVTDNPDAVLQLRGPADQPLLSRPVVLIQGPDAAKLMNIVNTQKMAHARIAYQPGDDDDEQSGKEYIEIGVFFAFFVIVCIVCVLIVLKMKWRQQSDESSLTRLARQAVGKMEVKRYHGSGGEEEEEERREAAEKPQRPHPSLATGSQPQVDAEMCVVCLEEYADGVERARAAVRPRVHKLCVDQWLRVAAHLPALLLQHCRRQVRRHLPALRRPSPRPAPPRRGSPQPYRIRATAELPRGASPCAASVSVRAAARPLTAGVNSDLVAGGGHRAAVHLRSDGRASSAIDGEPDARTSAAAALVG